MLSGLPSLLLRAATGSTSVRPVCLELGSSTGAMLSLDLHPEGTGDGAVTPRCRPSAPLPSPTSSVPATPVDSTRMGAPVCSPWSSPWKSHWRADGISHRARAPLVGAYTFKSGRKKKKILRLEGSGTILTLKRERDRESEVSVNNS